MLYSSFVSMGFSCFFYYCVDCQIYGICFFIWFLNKLTSKKIIELQEKHLFKTVFFFGKMGLMTLLF
ncbi:hypothetical protein FEDK69T_22910 [Flavobacterium enshiense DK69]|nr:hypothetical protein FEDK69T_22910 [Flavobacterium enshiense DK69]